MRRRVGRESLFFGAVSKIAMPRKQRLKDEDGEDDDALRPPAEQKNCALASSG